MNTTKSKKIIRTFQERKEKLKSLKTSFSGTWKTDLETFFSLLCPAREADWIPGWEAEILHSENGGMAAKDCVWRTDKRNPIGEGVWIMTDYQINDYLVFVKYHPDLIFKARITARDNGNGTVTGTWNLFCGALTSDGNRKVEETRKLLKHESVALPKVIEHYLAKGQQIKKPGLALKMAAETVRGHFH